MLMSFEWAYQFVSPSLSLGRIALSFALPGTGSAPPNAAESQTAVSQKPERAKMTDVCASGGTSGWSADGWKT